ncbi:MAG: chromosome segregation protein SMC [Fidelibacterota bacterium]
MYISKLSLYGFKSFSKKSEIYFGKGITAIVGPNGCGKTNIVDAIRWVIGEQKSSVLRADRNTDVIFNGTVTRRPLNLAEVSLTIHNVSGRITLPYADIVITRRVYRNGEGEYFINNNLCRLKDITDLFIDTGMGANAYSIIELKMIEDILSENPEERKRMFEEAAGVNKYRVQRKAALRKLEATREDLVRLNDIISEVDAKVKNLRRQLRRYEKHQEITANLIDTEVRLATRKVADIQSSVSPLETRIAEAKDRLTGTIHQLKQKESIWQQRQSEFEEQETILEEKNRQLTEIREEYNQFTTKELLLKEQLRNVHQTVNRLKNDIRQAENTLESANQKKIDLEQQYLTTQQLLNERRETFKAIESDSTTVEQQFSGINAEIQALQEERFGLSKKQTENSMRFSNLQENIDQREKELHTLEEQISAQKNNEETIRTSLQSIREQIDALELDLQQKRDNRDELEQRYGDYFQKEQELQQEHRALESRLDRYTNQIRFYQEIIQSKEGFSPGLQYVLDHLTDFPGIKGALSDLLAVDREHYLAVEAVLKDISRLLVAENREAALNTLAILADKGKGRVSIIPLDRQYHSDQGATIRDLSPLSAHIKCEQSLSNLKEFLFNGIYCCKDADFHRLIQNPDLDGVPIVSDRGRFRDADGILTGGSQTGESNILVGRSERLHQLESEADNLSSQLRAVAAQLDSLRQDLKSVGDQKESTAQAIKDGEQHLYDLNARLNKEEAQLTESSNIQKTLEENRVALEVLIENFRERMQREDPGKTDIDEQIAALEQKINVQKEKAATVKSELDRLIAERQNRRIELINLENRFRNICDNQEITRRSIQRTLESRDRALTELEKTEREAADIAGKIEANRQQLDQARNRMTAAEEDIESFRQSFQTNRLEIQRLNESLLKLRHEKELLSDSISKLELDRSEYKAAINEIKTVLMEKYKREIPAEPPEDLPEKDELLKKVERLKRNLELIGMVNMTVKEEYEEENSRLEFLTEQRDDLIKSEKGLNDVITQIDNVAREQFSEIFNKICQNFKTTFSIFFDGGEADLKLIGDSDPLEAQIEIWACPSGKKMRSLKMLSAGEKALTAIALLFGIYQVKPSPFCILDEVDAPLDDENTRRFTNVIRTFAEKTQFIIVTHNKSTMSIADSLYGITMAESGISQIVSVKLE